MTFALGIGNIKSCLMVVRESIIFWNLGEVTQIIDPKRRSLDPYGERCTFLVLRKSQITCWRHDHSQEHVSNKSVDINFTNLAQPRCYFFIRCPNNPQIRTELPCFSLLNFPISP